MVFLLLIIFGITSMLFIVTQKRVKNFGELRLKSETLSIKNLQQGMMELKQNLRV